MSKEENLILLNSRKNREFNFDFCFLILFLHFDRGFESCPFQKKNIAKYLSSCFHEKLAKWEKPNCSIQVYINFRKPTNFTTILFCKKCDFTKKISKYERDLLLNWIRVKFRQNTQCGNYEKLHSRNFCRKSMIVNFCNFHTVQHRFSMFLFLFTEISTRCPSLIRGQSGFSSDSCLQIGSIGPLFSKCTSFMLETSPFWFARGYSDKFAQIVLHLDGYFTHWGQRYPTSFHTKWKVSG